MLEMQGWAQGRTKLGEAEVARRAFCGEKRGRGPSGLGVRPGMGIGMVRRGFMGVERARGVVMRRRRGVRGWIMVVGGKGVGWCWVG